MDLQSLHFRYAVLHRSHRIRHKIYSSPHIQATTYSTTAHHNLQSRSRKPLELLTNLQLGPAQRCRPRVRLQLCHIHLFQRLDTLGRQLERLGQRRGIGERCWFVVLDAQLVEHERRQVGGGEQDTGHAMPGESGSYELGWLVGDLADQGEGIDTGTPYCSVSPRSEFMDERRFKECCGEREGEIHTSGPYSTLVGWDRKLGFTLPSEDVRVGPLLAVLGTTGELNIFTVVDHVLGRVCRDGTHTAQDEVVVRCRQL